MATALSLRVRLPLRMRGHSLVAQKPFVKQEVNFVKPKRTRGVRCSSGTDDENYVPAHVIEAGKLSEQFSLVYDDVESS